MAYAEGSKILALKDVNNVRTLYEVTKDDLRKIPVVNELPSPSKSKKGLVYLYDDGDGEKQYVCVQTGENEYGWVAVLDGTSDAMEAAVYDPSGEVEKAGGIPEYVDDAISDSEERMEQYTDSSVSGAISSIPQSDWSITNRFNKAFIKNKPFYSTPYSSDIFIGSVSFAVTPTETRTWLGKTYYIRRFYDHQSSNHQLIVGDQYTVSDGQYTWTGIVQSASMGGDPNYDAENPLILPEGAGYVFFEIHEYITDERQHWAYIPCVGVTATQLPFLPKTITVKHTMSYQRIQKEYIPMASDILMYDDPRPVSGRSVGAYAEAKSAKVTTIDSSSTDSQYPSAKAVYDFVDDTAELQTRKVTTIGSSSTDSQYPSAKAVYDLVSQSSGGSSVRMGTINLGTSWSGSDPYSQTVTVTGVTVTANSKVDLQPDSSFMSQLTTDGVTALWIENNNGVLTAYAIGGSPSVAMTVQCTVTEIS